MGAQLQCSSLCAPLTVCGRALFATALRWPQVFVNFFHPSLWAHQLSSGLHASTERTQRPTLRGCLADHWPVETRHWPLDTGDWREAAGPPDGVQQWAGGAAVEFFTLKSENLAAPKGPYASALATD